MKLARYTQTTSERKLYSIDYSAWLTTGETVSSVVTSIDNVTSPVFEVINVQILNAGKGVAFLARGGVAGERYELSVEATTSIGQTKEDKIYFAVTL